MPLDTAVDETHAHLSGNDPDRPIGAPAATLPPSRLYARLVRGWPIRILLVLIGVSGAFFLRELLARRHPGFAPFITFYPVVLLAALLDGAWAGILVTLLAAAAAAIWIFPPTGSLAIHDASDVLALAIFSVFGIALSIVIEKFHRSRERLALYELNAAVEAERRITEQERHVAETVRELVRERTRLLEIANAQLEADLFKLEQTQLNLAESRARLQAALASMMDSVIITDADGNFVDFNDAFAGFYRFKSKAECARNFTEFRRLFHITQANGEPVPYDQLAVPRALRGESASNVEFSYRRRDTGETWTGTLSFSPIRDPNGVITGSVITARDITAARRAEDALRESEKLAFQREQLQALAERLRQAREEERTSLARDLHDQIGQILTAIKMDLKWIARRSPQPEIQARLGAAIDLVDEGVHSVQTLCSGLRPPILDDLGLVAAVEWQAREFTSRTGIACTVSAPTLPLPLDSEQTTASFRIFQECFTNIIRHAEATAVTARLSSSTGQFTMEIEDNGKGFGEVEASRSLGILGMKERAHACGGDLQVISAPGAGATIVLTIPVHAAHPVREVPCTS